MKVGDFHREVKRGRRNRLRLARAPERSMVRKAR